MASSTSSQQQVYLLFAKEVGPLVKSKYPTIQKVQFNLILGRIWSEMPDSEKALYKQKAERVAKQECRPVTAIKQERPDVTSGMESVEQGMQDHPMFPLYYTNMATTLKKIYTDKTEQELKQKAFAMFKEMINSEKNLVSSPPVPAPSRPSPAPSPPAVVSRPAPAPAALPTAYQLFTKEMLPILSSQYSYLNSKELGQLMSRMWVKMADKDKAKYEEMVKSGPELHKTENLVCREDSVDPLIDDSNHSRDQSSETLEENTEVSQSNVDQKLIENSSGASMMENETFRYAKKNSDEGDSDPDDPDSDREEEIEEDEGEVKTQFDGDSQVRDSGAALVTDEKDPSTQVVFHNLNFMETKQDMEKLTENMTERQEDPSPDPQQNLNVENSRNADVSHGSPVNQKRVEKANSDTAEPPVVSLRKTQKLEARVEGEAAVEFCYCRTSNTSNLIGCDFCPLWFHPQCLGLNKAELRMVLSLSNWKCPECFKKQQLQDRMIGSGEKMAEEAVKKRASPAHNKQPPVKVAKLDMKVTGTPVITDSAKAQQKSLKEAANCDTCKVLVDEVKRRGDIIQRMAQRIKLLEDSATFRYADNNSFKLNGGDQELSK